MSSVVYGLLGLAAFVQIMEPTTGGRSVLAGALTMALLVLPIIIVATREVLHAVPEGIRLAGLAMGAAARRWCAQPCAARRPLWHSHRGHFGPLPRHR
ncbi:hypothetical protein IQ265_05930 [Nodosilinea sp. LEGE 06152]|uniref:hypothetical protein n=1 Tax=Nodosilinea sp. LEGE 06152 TaxID=2777966 RepID=UPI00187E1CA8|nr:hypothetical protein [Nodosilinea sp. LEGE 06152]